MLFLCQRLFFYRKVCSSIQTSLGSCDVERRWQTWRLRRSMRRGGKRWGIWIEVHKIVKNSFIFWYISLVLSKSWMIHNSAKCWLNEKMTHFGYKLHMLIKCLNQNSLLAHSTSIILNALHPRCSQWLKQSRKLIARLMPMMRRSLWNRKL